MTVSGVNSHRNIKYPTSTPIKANNQDLLNQINGGLVLSNMPLVAVHDNLKPTNKQEKTELPKVLQPPTSEQLQEEAAKSDNPFATKQEKPAPNTMPGIVAVHDNLKPTNKQEKMEIPKALQPPTSEQLKEEAAKNDNPFTNI